MYNPAIRNFKKAMTIHKKIEQVRPMASCLLGLGLCYFHKNEFATARVFFEDCISLSSRISRNDTLAEAQTWLSKIPPPSESTIKL
jgi:uncharacterized protein HemY